MASACSIEFDPDNHRPFYSFSEGQLLYASGTIIAIETGECEILQIDPQRVDSLGLPYTTYEQCPPSKFFVELDTISPLYSDTVSFFFTREDIHPFLCSTIPIRDTLQENIGRKFLIITGKWEYNENESEISVNTSWKDNRNRNICLIERPIVSIFGEEGLTDIYSSPRLEYVLLLEELAIISNRKQKIMKVRELMHSSLFDRCDYYFKELLAVQFPSNWFTRYLLFREFKAIDR